MRQRLSGIDIARGLALIGIIANHVFYEAHPTFVAFMQDYHAILFMFLSGIVFTYAQGTNPVLKNMVRGITCIILGLALGAGNPPADIILLNYGWTFILGSLIVPKSSKKTLLTLATLILLVGPVLSYAIRNNSGDDLPMPNVGFQMMATQPWVIITKPFFYGHYPILQWFSVFLFGAWIGKTKDLANLTTDKKLLTKVSTVCLVALLTLKSLSIAVAHWGLNLSWTQAIKHNLEIGTGNVPTDTPLRLFMSTPYSATPVALSTSLFAAIILVCLCSLIALRSPLSLVQRLGAATLTLYSLHLFIHTMVKPSWGNTHSFLYYGITMLVLMMVMEAWRYLATRKSLTPAGPIEHIIAMIVKTEMQKRQPAESQVTASERI